MAMHLGGRSARKLLVGLIGPALATAALGGCTPAEDEAPVEAPADHPAYAIHLVAETRGRAPDPGEAAGDPWKLASSRTEYWIAEGGDTYRTSREGYSGVESTETAYRQEELVANDILRVLQSEQPPGPAPSWHNMLERDASETQGDADEAAAGLPHEPLLTGDADFYRDSIESGEATVTARDDSGDVPTLTLVLERVRSWDSAMGMTLTVVVRQTDYLPISMEREEWRTDFENTPGRRHVFERRHIAYHVAEVVPWDEVPAQAMELVVPDDVPRIVDRHMTFEEAAAYRDPVVWWIGEELSGADGGDGLRLAEDPVITSGTWRHGHPGRGDVGIADLGRPLVSQATTEVVVHYEGPGEADVKICSIPRVDLATSSELAEAEDYHGADAVERLALDSRTAVIIRSHTVWTDSSVSSRSGRADTTPTGEGSGVQDYTYVLIDMGESTVIVQGWKIAEDRLVEIARELRRLTSD